MKKNIFVIGDLVIDHTIFVRADTERPHQAVEEEVIYEVFKRQDDAGGAANTARILAIVNKGKTFLWGIIGKSNWGDFRSILKNSYNLDETSMPIELRGANDETEAQMNTITRIIKINPSSENTTREHEVRFDDYGQAHITDVKRQSMLYYLRRAKEKYGGIDAIIINDLDYGCLTLQMIKNITDYAKNQTPEIPIFIDPKLDPNKYNNIHATAILPNLTEWWHLVGKPDTLQQWRDRLDSPAVLKKMAEKSFSQMKNIKYHIIKCDKDGAVIIAPHIKKRNLYSVYRVAAMDTTKPNPPHQLGCGDVMVGIFAHEFSGGELDSKRALRAFFRANAVVKCYRDMPWHTMPTNYSINKTFKKIDQIKLPKPIIDVSIGRLFLPKEKVINLSEYVTDISGLYSQDSDFRKIIKTLLDDIAGEWGPGRLTSIILQAKSGSGKSTIADWLIKELPQKNYIHVENMTGKLKNTFHKKEFNHQFEKLMKEIPNDCNKLLIIVDEALKNSQKKFLLNSGVNLLNAAHENNVRFLLIDADFDLDKDEIEFDSQFTSRCHYHRINGIENRLHDIPVIVAAYTFNLANESKLNLHCVRIECKLMLAIINATLAKPNPRILCNLVKKIFNSANRRTIRNKKLEMKIKDLPENIHFDEEEEKDIKGYYEYFI